MLRKPTERKHAQMVEKNRYADIILKVLVSMGGKWMDGICTHDAFTASITQQSLGHESENESGSKKKMYKEDKNKP